MPVDQVIHRGVMENLDFIPTGALPPNRSEFLLHLNFGELLETVSANYDLVLLDPPPILAVADALIIGAHAGAVFILTRAGVTTEGEINESIKRLNHAGISPQGVLFNDMALRLGGAATHTATPAPASSATRPSARRKTRRRSGTGRLPAVIGRPPGMLGVTPAA